jgi:N-acetylmuramoyl-L-alanine amidase
MPTKRRTTCFSKGVLCLYLLLCFSAAHSEQLKGVRMHDAPDYTRVVLDVTGVVNYDLFTLKNPDRVVIDLQSTAAARGFDAARMPVTGERIRKVRASARGADYRVVLDVSRRLVPRGFTLAPVAPYGDRLVVDLYVERPQAGKPVAAPRNEDKRDVVIAIDAGHGGEDPGALGPTVRGSRIREKDVVYQIAQRLQRKLAAAKGFRPVMVRQGDYYIALRKRVEIARKARADLFVSIHADAFRVASVSGASVYTLSEKGASSENARWLAEKENRSDLIGGVGGVSLDDKDDLLAHVLLDLSMDANRSASIQAGESLLGQLGSVAKLHKRRVEQAGFVVLKSPDVPSILVETGYISNPDEARRLHSADYQEKIAGALLQGIRAYMEQSAPPGTLIAWQRDQGSVRYTIARGDTLSGIAVRYGTSTRRIKQANGLSGDRIRVGQVIVIPAS